MHLEILDQHEDIGIDFDGTLVEHPRSPILQQYIIDHPEKRFHLVSFRTHQMRLRLEQNLKESTDQTGVPLTLAHFTSINCIADRLYERKGLLDDGREYWGWKALKCRELGCTLMVDDMHEQIGSYCHEIDIVCLNPDLHEGYVPPPEDPLADLIDWLSEEDRSQYGECKGPQLDELHQRGRIAWCETLYSSTTHLTWPPPNDRCWVELLPEPQK